MTSPRQHSWTTVGLIAVLFSVVIAGAMLANLRQLRAADPLQAGDLASLKAELALSPKDEALKTRIRDYDLSVRRTWFTRDAIADRGAWLLLAGVVVAIGALKLARRIEDKPFDPRSQAAPDVAREAAQGRWGVAAGGLALLGGMLALGSAAPTAPTAPSLPVKVVAAAPDTAAFARNWPSFRGPAAGLAQGDAPTSWNAAAGTNLRWKTALPLPGNNSPAVWEDTVYATGSDGAKQEVYAIDAASGARRWTCAIPLPAGAKVEPFDSTGFAASSPTTDGRYVVAIFASGALSAVSSDGTALWTKNLGVPDSQYSFASSPVIWRDRVLVQFDQGGESDGKSALLAFDLATGRELWRSKRASGNTWSSPIVAELSGKAQLITTGTTHAIAYDPATGTELWRAACMSGDIAPSPAVSGHHVIIANDRAKIVCLRTDGSGDVTETHLVWSGEDGLPDTVSPVADGELVAMISPSGLLTCLDAKTGGKVWEHEFSGTFSSSLILAGNKLYLTESSGLTHVIAWDRKAFTELGTGEVGEAVTTTPAIVGGRIFVRGKDQLFCLEAKP